MVDKELPIQTRVSMCYSTVASLMEGPLKELDDVCPSCGTTENEADASFCEACGTRLGSALLKTIPPPSPKPSGKKIANRYVIQSLLWTAPTYNAYLGMLEGAQGARFTIIEHRSREDDPLSGLSPLSSGREGTGALEDVAPGFERCGMFKPIEHAVEGDSSFIVFEEIHGQALSHLDQKDEKEARAIGLQLCLMAEQFHRHGWVYNGFEPYGIVIDQH